MRTSNVASFSFGEVHKGDLVACRGRRILNVDRFWDLDDAIAVQGRLLHATGNPAMWHPATESGVAFLESRELVHALAWASVGDLLRVVLPPSGLGFDE